VTQTASIWLVLVLAFLAANLPFLTQRVLGVVPLAGGKNLAVRLGELVLLYLLVGGIGVAFEKHAGQVAPQGWEFYAITGTLFVTFAFPGFVWRYLFQHGKHRNRTP
jgi:CDP-diglyceride synthetase